MEGVDALLIRQKELIASIKKLHQNFNKDGTARKTETYIAARINSLDSLWAEFDNNHVQLTQLTNTGDYFTKNIYNETKTLYEKIRKLLSDYGAAKFSGRSSSTSNEELEELMSAQSTNFRAFKRLVSNIMSEGAEETWELEDDLKSLQMRWNNIDVLHLKIDNILMGEDAAYEKEYAEYETEFRSIKKILNKKISSASQQCASMPKLEVPSFYGDYNQWPTFLDLYKSSIHDNPSITKAQKMQHLKGKLKGEALRLVQHLNVTGDNYDTAWELLYHRYNNNQVLFTKQMELFLNQPSIQKQTSSELKKLYDTSMECIHAVHNLGIDTTSWDPLLVHLLLKKLDPITRSDYMESRKRPRDLPKFDEFISFIEAKFIALEPICKNEKQNSTLQRSERDRKSILAPNTQRPSYRSSSRTIPAYINCLLCNDIKHKLHHCRRFKMMPPDVKYQLVVKHSLCKNCLSYHERNVCKSNKRCRKCNEEHNTLLHEVFVDLNTNETPSTTKPPMNHHNANNVTNCDDEILLTTVLIRVQTVDNTYLTMRALLDQGSQITLITENAAQRLGLPRKHLNASITGVCETSKRSKGKIQLQCKSVHDGYEFATEALVMPKLLNYLPHNTFEKRNYPHIQHIQLADPDYNVSSQIDILLDAKVYSDIIMGGLIRGEGKQPIAQQTRLGWILSGQVSTFNCNVVINNIEDIASYWEMEEISTEKVTMTQQEEFCEVLYSTTTNRLSDGRYEVRLPMKENFEENLGHSKSRAFAQFKQLERRLATNDSLREKYTQFMDEYKNLGHMKECTTQVEPMCYLPHHGVEREASTTTKLRVVYNASSKTSTGNSLNDLMECGPKLQHDIQDLLLRWRTYQYVYTADCEKMYRCIMLQEDQQHLQKIFWRDEPNNILKEYQLCTANRTKEILEVMPVTCWRHVSSQENAADCATRGLTTSQLKHHSLWWEGPSWIKEGGIPECTISIDTPQIEVKKEPKVYVTQLSFAVIECLLNKSSCLIHTIRVIGYISRFITNLRHRVTKRMQLTASSEHDTVSIVHNVPTYLPFLTSSEIEHATKVIIKAVQGQEFQHDIAQIRKNGAVKSKSDLLKLNPYLDDKNILRVGGRLEHSHLTEDAKHPMIIPKNSRLAELLIHDAHIQTLHGGPTLTLAYLRQQYWVLGGNRSVKKQIRKCVKCFRFSQHKHNQLMANLPEPRVTQSRAFTHTGVDFTGQVELKANKGRGIKTTKGYIAVFVCFSTKAIHLELVSDLSTPAFLAAFKRMCARRGKPKHMCSDNGTNFVGASRVLKREYEEVRQTMINDECAADLADMGITWHLNAPAWPSAGGLWEAAVKSTKHHLKRVLGEQKLTFEEFSTLLAQIEACLNSRPLCALTENAEDDYLTPGHFLIGGPILAPSLSDLGTKCIRTRWQLVEHMQREFWKKWSSDYLHNLQTRSKWNTPKKDLQIDDIVLIQEDNMPPAKWALGRVIETHPGKDGHTRVVTLKTKNSVTKRPIVKLAPLPIRDLDSAEQSSSDVTSGNEPDMSAPRTQRRNRGKPSSIMSILLLLLTVMFTPIKGMLDISPINNNNTLLFDKMTNIRVIQDEWKMVIFYNMTTYWQSMAVIENYIQAVEQSCKSLSVHYLDTSCLPVITQFEHELKEIRHYNELLRNPPSPQRRKRGLINGVGYLANTLFGVLDDRFAEKYEHDIQAIQNRETHLFNLFKNQTSVLEAENNILKRNEILMNKQFSYINQTIAKISSAGYRMQIAAQTALNSFHTLATLLSFDVIISNFRRIQEALLDTVTDIYHGRLNIHLLSPEQIQEQLNLISGHIQDDLIVPAETVRELYGLMQTKVRVTNQYLIMELSMLNRNLFELDEIIDIPQRKGQQMIYTSTETKYLAINVKKDTVLPMTERDLQSCIQHTQKQMLCPLNHPIYSLQIGESICNMRLLISNQNKPFCRSELKQCTDRWTKLHQRDAWFYSCCEGCSIRMICKNEVIVKRLQGNGLLTLHHGCMLKGESFIIHAQHDYTNKIVLQNDLEIDTPHMPSLNEIMNTSLSSSAIITERHDKEYDSIQQQIDNLKRQELPQLSLSDSTHYAIIYPIISVIVIAIIALIICQLKTWCHVRHKRTENRVIGKSTDISLQDIRVNQPAPPKPPRVPNNEVPTPGTSSSTPNSERLNFNIAR